MSIDFGLNQFYLLNMALKIISCLKHLARNTNISLFLHPTYGHIKGLRKFQQGLLYTLSWTGMTFFKCQLAKKLPKIQKMRNSKRPLIALMMFVTIIFGFLVIKFAVLGWNIGAKEEFFNWVGHMNEKSQFQAGRDWYLTRVTVSGTKPKILVGML